MLMKNAGHLVTHLANYLIENVIMQRGCVLYGISYVIAVVFLRKIVKNGFCPHITIVY